MIEHDQISPIRNPKVEPAEWPFRRLGTEGAVYLDTRTKPGPLDSAGNAPASEAPCFSQHRRTGKAPGDTASGQPGASGWVSSPRLARPTLSTIVQALIGIALFFVIALAWGVTS